jgi:hypothetical protein
MPAASAHVVQLPAPWNSAYGIATNRTASPVTGNSLTHEVDCVIDFTWTAATNEVLEIDLRRTGADNRWIVRCDQAGSTIKLIERNGGTETERASAAQTWTNGTVYRILAYADGNTIFTKAGTVGNIGNKNSYASATFNNTATIAMVSGFATGTNFVAWPRTLTGTALSVLQAANP